MEFHELRLGDKPLVEKYLSQDQSIGSENSFTNMFMWRVDYHVRIAEEAGLLFVTLAHPSFGTVYRIPVGENPKRGIEMLREEVGEDLVICPIGEYEKRCMEECYPDLSMTHLRSMDDYVYRIEDLISLKGKKYHGKRNHLNYFLNTYAWEYHPITPEKIEECHRAVNQWVKERNESPEEELRAMDDLFLHYEALGLTGAYITVDGEMKGVTVGEEHHGVALIHVEKCDTDIRGIYVAINQMFLAHEFSHLEYVNREEDMGEEGLRHAKMSYHPAFLVERYMGRWQK